MRNNTKFSSITRNKTEAIKVFENRSRRWKRLVLFLIFISPFVISMIGFHIIFFFAETRGSANSILVLYVIWDSFHLVIIVCALLVLILWQPAVFFKLGFFPGGVVNPINRITGKVPVYPWESIEKVEMGRYSWIEYRGPVYPEDYLDRLNGGKEPKLDYETPGGYFFYITRYGSEPKRLYAFRELFPEALSLLVQNIRDPEKFDSRLTDYLEGNY